jgi:2'-5' RNA ligase
MADRIRENVAKRAMSTSGPTSVDASPKAIRSPRGHSIPPPTNAGAFRASIGDNRPVAWFFAVRPDDETCGAILDACAAWRREARAIEPLRWASRRKLHYTLRYLGHVEPARLDELCAVGRAAAAQVAPFDLAIEHVGAFPSEARAKVVWLGAGEGRAPLAQLAGALEAGVAALGFPPGDHGEYTPHLTLARISDRVKFPALAAAIALRRDLALGRFRVAEIELMESKANVDAYESLARFTLG